MKIWKLIPVDLDFHGWCGSSYKGEAIVRARNEEEARDIASLNFRIFAQKDSPAQQTPSSPWINHAVVKCEELENSKYSTDGPSELLEPKNI